MRRSRRWSIRDDSGSASLEFLALGTLLIVPLAYLMLTLSSLQAASLAAEAGARNAARILAADPGDPDAEELAMSVIELAAGDHDFDPDDVEHAVSCRGSTPKCTNPGDVISVNVTIEVPLPFAANLTAGAVPIVLPFSATSSFATTSFGGTE